MQANDNPNGDQLVSVSIVPYEQLGEHGHDTCIRVRAHQRAQLFPVRRGSTRTTSPPPPSTPPCRCSAWVISTATRTGGRTRSAVPACHTPTNTAADHAVVSNDEDDLHDLIDSLQANGLDRDRPRHALGCGPARSRGAPGPLGGLSLQGRCTRISTVGPRPTMTRKTLKVIVLMTDGVKQARQYDLQDQYRSGPSPFLAQNPSNGRLSIYRASTNRFWQVSNDRWRDSPDGGNKTPCRLDYADLWNQHSRAPDRRPAQQRAGLVYPWPAVSITNSAIS